MQEIKIEHVTKKYHDKTVLADYSASLAPGGFYLLQGPSGCGKTTLARLLASLENADSGLISGLPDRISMDYQEDRLCESFDAKSNVRLAASTSLHRDSACEAHIEKLLTRLGLDPKDTKPVREYSGGMKRRVTLARCLLAPGDLMILDEPFDGLDEDNKRAAMELTREYAKGRTTVLITHNEKEAAFFTEATPLSLS